MFGVILDSVFPADVTIRADKDTYSLKVAVWQSADSYGYVKIMGTVEELPKITRRGQLIAIRQTRGKQVENYRGEIENIAVLPPQFTTHREVLILSEHELDVQNLIDSQGNLKTDKYSIKKKDWPVDGTMKDYLNEMWSRYLSYDSGENFCPVDPKKYRKYPNTCASIFNVSQKWERNRELNLAYIVAVWHSEERQDDVVELFDLSCLNEDEKHWPEDFKLNYKRARKVPAYHEDVPTAFVRIPKVEKYYPSCWYDRDPNWKRSGRLINIRKINLQDSLITLVQSDSQAMSGYQGFDTIDSDSPYAHDFRVSYKMMAKIKKSTTQLSRKRKNSDQMTPNEFAKVLKLN